MINETSRKKMLALVHIQKAQSKISDEDYLEILYACAKVDSAAKIDTIKQFKAVINTLNKVLVSQGQSPVGDYSRKKPYNLISATKAKAAAVLGAHAQTRIAGFLKKMNVATLEDCTDRQLRRVMGFLTTIERNGSPRK